ncbi:hypothetical protein DFH06DRAFT_52463 [Mycena polygramma]|nr:hypothetical protein DFH06DRAFT_52463 [Mycena polygramma]
MSPEFDKDRISVAQDLSHGTVSSKNSHQYVTIKEMLVSPRCPAMFYVRARAVDFFPFYLKDSFVRKCIKCADRSLLSQLVCNRCNANDFKIVSILRLMVDDGEQRLRVSISGNVPVLHGINPTILRDDPEVAARLSDRLRPLIGNLEAVHDGYLREEHVELSGPIMSLVIDNWRGVDGSVMYGLRDFGRNEVTPSPTVIFADSLR